MIGSAKDMIVKGDLTITNSNKTENSVVVLGSADDIHFRSEYLVHLQRQNTTLESRCY